MKKFLMAAAAVALLGSVAFAGPNVGGTVIVHNANLVYAGGLGYSACGLGTPPADCNSANTEITGSDNTYWVWKVYAAFAPCSAPRLKAFDFGINYPSNIILIDHANAAAGTGCIGDPNNGALEQDGAGWPNSGSGCALNFQYTQTTTLVQAYWFAGYAYYGAPGVFALGPGIYGGAFADDGVPPNVDPIAGYGSLGFNMPGSVACPSAAAEGACCVGAVCSITCESACQGTFKGPGVPCDPNPCAATGACCIGTTCVVTTQADCLQRGGDYKGDGVVCTDQLCQPVPTKVESWGQIKHSYR